MARHARESWHPVNTGLHYLNGLSLVDRRFRGDDEMGDKKKARG
jgi:hypothetical protein